MFPPTGVLSFGFHLVDGPTFSSPKQKYPRRSFRVTMYDMSGMYIHQYRWYLAHAPKFYGATVGPGFSNGGIGYIEISVEEPGPIAMSDLTYSTVNVATTSISGKCIQLIYASPQISHFGLEVTIIILMESCLHQPP